MVSRSSSCSGDNFAKQPSFGATTNLKKAHKKKLNHPITINSLGLISGSAHSELTQEIAQLLGVKMIDSTATRFADGEVSIQINETISGKDIFIVQPCAAPVNDSIMELLLTISCVRRAGAERIVAVIPYFGYKHHRRGTAVSTKHDSRYLTSGAVDFAKMLQEMGVDHVISVDVQRPGQGQEACFFSNDIPLEVVLTTELLTSHIIQELPYSSLPASTSPSPSPSLPPPSAIVVLAPNEECLKKADRVRRGLAKAFPHIEVRLSSYLSSTSGSGPVNHSDRQLELLGDNQFSGSDVIIVDDMVDTAGTLSVLSSRLKQMGARDVYACASHGLLSGAALSRLGLSPVKKVLVTNSLPLPPAPPAPSPTPTPSESNSEKVKEEKAAYQAQLLGRQKVVQVSVAPMLAHVILADHFRSVGRRDQEETFVLED